MGALLGLVLLGWLGLHLSGFGVLVWEETAPSRYMHCSYLHSTGIHRNVMYRTDPCPKTIRFG